MTGWYAKNLGDAMLAGEQLERIEAAFTAAYVAAGRPAGMAVFIRHESDGRLHCEVKAYFSPASAPVARELYATPCERPSPGDLGVLAGDEAALTTLFRGPDR